MIRRKRHTEEGLKTDTSSWMVTFSDLIMLLLTFFVMLLTLSSMDNKALKDILTSLRGAVGLLEFSGQRGIGDLANFVKKFHDSDTLLMIDQRLFEEMLIPVAEAEKKMEKTVRDLSNLIDITDDARGLVFTFQENILFDPGEVTIKKEGFGFLDSIATAIEAWPNDILIMGHTDNSQAESKLYGSNWGLSAYRGMSVLEYFLEEKGLSPLRFTVGGYGPSRPLRPNDTPRNRALNRRIEIIFKH